jgi:hypothetical protein
MKMKINTQLCIVISMLILAGCNPPAGNASSGTSVSDPVANEKSTVTVPGDTVPKTNSIKPDYNRLVGDWLRTDGGKIIRIKSAMADGKLDAEYYNPKPIHVSRAEWIIKDNNLIFMVELQDVNYPGSTYTLQYFPSDDQLAGNYFQAVEKANYEVDFIRQR